LSPSRPLCAGGDVVYGVRAMNLDAGLGDKANFLVGLLVLMAGYTFTLLAVKFFVL
jgi:hypothetical protein